MVRLVWELWNVCTFNCCLNVRRDGEEVITEGKSFHIHVPATGKEQRPAVESLAGTDYQW